MGEELGNVFTTLSNELTLLSWQANELKQLYPGPGQRLALMNRAAPFFFWLLQRTWFDEVLLGVTRLVAPLKSAGKNNLTFQQLPGLVQDKALSARVKLVVKSAVDKAQFAVEWRNKRIAHRDLSHALKKAPQPLPPATLPDVEAVLEELAAALNEIQREFLDSTTLYSSALYTHGVKDLLYVVRDGIRLEDLRQKRLQTGDYRPEEWGDGDPAL